MRRLIVGAALASALAVSGTASAGGWATAGLGPPPGGIAPGDTWNAEVTILQHGQTPLAGVKPTVTIRNAKTATTRTFPARPTGERGVYRAEVVFPESGTWRYSVYDGFVQYGGAKTHTFAPITVGSSSGASGFDLPTFWPGLLAGAAMLAAAGLAIAMRRRQQRPAPAR